MYTNTVFFFRPVDLNHSCLKVFNASGDELSLAGDDSCGAMTHHARCQLAIFPAGGHTMMKDEIMYVTPEELLNNLAAHLGYTVQKLRNQ
jgi:hypothetical protein